jgi:undecaprenyl-diphosphatase
MEIIQAAILGIVQGLTEFLPISSSGHLVLLPWLFNWKDPGLTFDVALHLGTLLSLLLFFWRDWLDILSDWKKPLLWLIVIGSIPAAVIGYKYDDYFETVFRSPLVVAGLMAGMGVLMWIAESVSRKDRDVSSVNLGDTLFIGFAQALALMPGVSRSGITITAGLFDRLKRESAARFSFLLAMPITAGAGLLKLKHLATDGLPAGQAIPFTVGIVFSTIVGFLAIKFLLKYLEDHTLYIFVWYRIIFAAIAVAVYFAR